MRVQIDRLDVHVEQCGSSTVPVLHRFVSDPKASQDVFFVDGAPVLRDGDGFEHEGGPDHGQPKQGSFVRPPSRRGSFTASGQPVLQINGVAVMVHGGRLETCHDGATETSCKAATLRLTPALLYVEDEPVLTGRSN